MSYMLIVGFFTQDKATFNYGVYYFSTIIAIVFVLTFVDIRKVINSYLFAIGLICSFGVISFILAAFGLLSPFSEFNWKEGHVMYNYILTMSNSVYIFGDVSFIRIAGYFNEPGALAYYCTYALVLNKLTQDHKRFEVLMITAGFLTLSHAFLITVIFYLIFFYLRKSLLKLSIIIITFFTSLILIYSIYREGPLGILLHERVFVRFQPKLFVDSLHNRFSLDNAFNFLSEQPFFGHGTNGLPLLLERGYRGGSIFDVILANGLVGTSIIFLFPLFMLLQGIRTRRISTWGAVFLLWLNYLQRPHVVGFYVLMWIYLVTYMIEQKRHAQKRGIPEVTTAKKRNYDTLNLVGNRRTQAY
jgi:hypothetical protein